MQIVIVSQSPSIFDSIPEAEIIHVASVEEMMVYNQATVFIDVDFEFDAQRINALKQLLPAPILINCVSHTLKEIGAPFIRMNAWPGFTATDIEIHAPEEYKNTLRGLFEKLQLQPVWLPDVTGFITPRVISMIINEAYLALEAGVSTKEEINKAMKLGTNYPYGPFEWAEKIGYGRINNLLLQLSRSNAAYTPAPLLKVSI